MRDSIRFRALRATVLLLLLAFVMLPIYISISSAFKPLATSPAGPSAGSPARRPSGP